MDITASGFLQHIHAGLGGVQHQEDHKIEGRGAERQDGERTDRAEGGSGHR